MYLVIAPLSHGKETGDRVTYACHASIYACMHPRTWARRHITRGTRSTHAARTHVCESVEEAENAYAYADAGTFRIESGHGLHASGAVCAHL